MATDIDVQYFSHLNGLTLSNNWGDLIRLLDKALVTGIDFTSITAASIDEQGDVHITLYAAHNAMLFQVVELTGFAPASLNQKYRIKGVPSTTELILKPHTVIAETSITTVGAGKLASLGYEIIFRDTNDVKRVYRAKNPNAEHPFIRVDESLTSPDGTTGVYTSTYAKSAMVGLIENMTHIDDYSDTSKLQLPLDTSDFEKNWKINRTGTDVIRGWSRWYWASAQNNDLNSKQDSAAPAARNRGFTIFGDKDAFYLQNAQGPDDRFKRIYGCGLFQNSISNVLQPWFLMSDFTARSAVSTAISSLPGILPLTQSASGSKFMTLNTANTAQVWSNPILPSYQSGYTNEYGATDVAALSVPFYDDDLKLRGNLKHVYYSGKKTNLIQTTPILANASMYVFDSTSHGTTVSTAIGGVYAYLGELE